MNNLFTSGLSTLLVRYLAITPILSYCTMTIKSSMPQSR